ncbi:MAG TPA: glycoside hydrolase family 15 protein [Gemmatimonadaceae bacterium]
MAAVAEGAISAYRWSLMERIEEYALIGDCLSAALVSRGGSIDWLCWPRFDSGALFAALLGSRDNGRWLIAPRASDAKITRRYHGETMILETDFETPDGVVRVTDFMPVGEETSDVVRIVKGLRGRVAMRTELIFRFSYGALVPWVTRLPDGRLRAISGPDMVTLRADVELKGVGLTTVGEFEISEGACATFVLTWSPSNRPPPEPADPRTALERTTAFWEDWASECTYKGEWREPVVRSLLVLKALTYGPTGGIVAAPTTSLPEQIGGVRNWDYRYCWLRDATLTLLALMDSGYYREASAWREWLLRAAAGSPSQIQIMYGLAGERFLWEWELPWLPGYENSKPVRIGNAAHEQFQLDVFGEVMDALHQARVGGIDGSRSAWRLQTVLIAQMEKTWRQPDQGIWETRGRSQHFTHSKVMAWVAADRVIKSAEQFKLEGPIDHWRELRDEIHADICANAFDPELNSFVQAYGSKLADASTLMIPLVGFLPPHDPRVIGTVEYVERNLLVDGFVLRYDSAATDDGLPAGEGAFLACNFWLADNYALIGRRDDAVRMFQRMLDLRNDVGLLSEEYDQALKRQCGNFPQAFSHISLLSTAYNLAHVARPVEQRTVER